ncbi:MAG: hypothetical protein BWX50_00607 [Euryarchaeota archaeon ADurb.Bin009]|nr:MAG: hypothetical protein BWX50_00607 [Euryarchaeota archaeon ADurb.Bin009]
MIMMFSSGSATLLWNSLPIHPELAFMSVHDAP